MHEWINSWLEYIYNQNNYCVVIDVTCNSKKEQIYTLCAISPKVLGFCGIVPPLALVKVRGTRLDHIRLAEGDREISRHIDARLSNCQNMILVNIVE